jgi:hypothetical protein
MKRLIVLMLMMASANAFAIVIIPPPPSLVPISPSWQYESQNDAYDRNRAEEQQELLRRQVRIQQQMLDLQRIQQQNQALHNFRR